MCNHKRLFFTFLFLLLYCGVAVCQQHKPLSPAERKLDISIVATRNAFADAFFSSVPYRAWAPAYVMTYVVQKDRQRQYISGGYSSGKYSNDNNSAYTAMQSNFSLGYNKVFSVTTNKRINLMLGGGVEMIYNNRRYRGFINSTKSFESINSLNAAADADILINEKNDLRLYLIDRFRMPFLSLLYQPSFASEDTEGGIRGKQGLSNFFASSKLASINQYVAAANSLCVTKEISPTTSLSLQYDLLYRKLSTQRPVRHLYHGVGISLSFHL